jgi:uncharacterized protein YecT (DUF1311 family)
MRKFIVLLTCAFGLAAFAGAARAEEKCPKGDAPIFEEDLRAAPDCAAAHALHSACAWGSSGDAGLTGVVVEKCEALFLSRLTKAQKRNYDARVQRCSDKYAREQGTIAIAETAMCQEDIAASFAKDSAAAGRIKAAPLAPVKASFDCGKAQSPLEQLICSDDDLAALDIDLSDAYKKAFKGAATEARKALVASENRWLAYVASSCLSGGNSTDLARLCATGAFRERVGQIPLCMAKAGGALTVCLDNYSPAPAKATQ